MVTIDMTVVSFRRNYLAFTAAGESDPPHL
jgi:hypothetical protein